MERVAEKNGGDVSYSFPGRSTWMIKDASWTLPGP